MCKPAINSIFNFHVRGDRHSGTALDTKINDVQSSSSLQKRSRRYDTKSCFTKVPPLACPPSTLSDGFRSYRATCFSGFGNCNVIV
jgi:hypothetical protein